MFYNKFSHLANTAGLCGGVFTTPAMVGVGGEWKAEGGQYYPQGGKQQCCVFSRAQKLPQSSWYKETVVSSSLTPQETLLMPISGPTDFY